MCTTSGEYWELSIGQAFLNDPEGFKRKRQNREYTAKEKQELKYLNMSKQDVTNESFLEAEWDHVPRTKLSEKLTNIYEKYFKALLATATSNNKDSNSKPQEPRIKQNDAIQILQNASSTDTYAKQILETVKDPAFQYTVPIGIVGTKLDDMNNNELLLWLGAADSKQTTSFFITKQESELAIAEEENILTTDIDWALQSSTLDLATGRPRAMKQNNKKSSLKQSSSLGGLSKLNGNSNSMILGNGFADNCNNNGNSMFQSSVNKFGQKSRYAPARPAGLPGRTYHLHGLPCRLYDIFGEPRERPVRVNSVAKYDLNKVTNERFAKIEAPVRRVTRTAATEILKNSLSAASFLASSNANLSNNSSSMLLGEKSTMGDHNEGSAIMSQVNSSASNILYQQSLSLRPGISIEIKPGNLNFGRLCVGKTYVLTFSCLNISLEAMWLSLIPSGNRDWLQCNFLESGSLPPGLSRIVEVKLNAKEVGIFTTIVKIKSPNEIIEMPIHARIEHPTKHNPRTGPKPSVILLKESVNAIGKNNRSSLENKINDDNNNHVEEKAQGSDKWPHDKVAYDKAVKLFLHDT
jgi:hypothetical protein